MTAEHALEHPPADLPTLAISVPAAIATLDGALITAGLAEVTVDGGAWTVRLTKLDRPGLVASMFFGQRLREVRFRLDDGREGTARIARTTFVAGQERECRLIGLTELAHDTDAAARAEMP